MATLVSSASAQTWQSPDSFSGMKFQGSSTPQGAPPWNVSVDFDTGIATWSKSDGAKAQRLLSLRLSSGQLVAMKFQAHSPVGIPDLICIGTSTGNAIDMQCNSNASAPPEKLVGTISKK